MPAGSTATVLAFGRLRWRLLAASLHGRGPEKAGVLISTVTSMLVGVGAGVVLAIAGRRADDGELFVLVCALATFAVLSLSVVAGVTQPIDPRVLATEPISDRQRSLGMLVATASGPPGLAGGLVGAGAVVGAARSPSSIGIVLLAVVAWLVTLLLVSRTAANVLGLVATRSPRAGQFVVAITGLVFYGGVQFVPSALAAMDDGDRDRFADALALTPPGQLGRSLAAVDASPLAAGGHLVAGAALIPVLLAVHGSTTRRLAASVRSTGSGAARPRPGWLAVATRWACGTGATGAIAWRSLLTRLRTPRTAVETFTGAGVGMAAVVVPALTRDGVGGGAVLVGGAVQLAVLFMAGNSFGNDGPALAGEMLAGAGPHDLAAGKARSITIVAAPLAVIGPLLVASLTGEWTYLPAGVLVGAGALLGGAAGAIVQSTFVPVAVPDSENPLASGESGRGVVAALLLAGVLIALSLVTLPLGLALLWANDRGSVVGVTALGAVAVVAGWLVRRGAVALAARRIATRGPAFIDAITPAR